MAGVYMLVDRERSWVEDRETYVFSCCISCCCVFEGLGDWCSECAGSRRVSSESGSSLFVVRLFFRPLFFHFFSVFVFRSVESECLVSICFVRR